MDKIELSRRHMLLGAGAAAVLASPANAFQIPSLKMIGKPSTDNVPGALMRRAIAALRQHRGSIRATDRIGIVDFSQPSRNARFHIIDMMSGKSQTLLVAHGRGSDPEHRGWLEWFSNEPGSNATSAGTYVTGEAYIGRHGTSRRLLGLDPTNNNAEARAIVIHAAKYVSPEIIAVQGKLGRSEGCLAVTPNDIDMVMNALGEGRMIYANRRDA